MKRVPLIWWASLIFLLACLAFLFSLEGCAAMGRLVRTTEFGVVHGRFEGDGDQTDGDINALTLSIEPFALMKPEPERSMPVYHEPAIDDWMPVFTGPEVEPEPYNAKRDNTIWWKDAELLAWLGGIIMAVIAIFGGKKGIDAYKQRKPKQGVSNE